MTSCFIFYCNYGHILYRFRHKDRYRSKIAIIFLPSLHNKRLRIFCALSFTAEPDGLPCDGVHRFWKDAVFMLHLFMQCLCLFVFMFMYTRVTETQTENDLNSGVSRSLKKQTSTQYRPVVVAVVCSAVVVVTVVAAAVL